MAMMSIQAMKGVGIGDGFELAGVPGSQAHDEIFHRRRARLTSARRTAPAGSRAA